MPRPLAIAMSLLVALPLMAGCAAPRSALTGPPVLRASQPRVQAKSVTGSRPVATVDKARQDAGHVLTTGGGITPAFAPAGDRLAYAVPGRGLMLAQADGSHPMLVAGSAPTDTDPAFSPRGDALAFVRPRGDGGMTLLRLEPATSRLTVLYEGPELLKQPAWLPGGASVVVVAATTAETVFLQVGAAGGRPTVLWRGAGGGAPTIAPDGRSLVFERSENGVTGLARLPLPGGLAAPLLVTGAHPRRPVFSPSGRSLAYLADDGLYVAGPDGSQGQRVIAGQGWDSPSWHPAAPQLVVSAVEGAGRELVRLDLPAR